MPFLWLTVYTVVKKLWVSSTDISHYRLLFVFFLLNTDCLPFELVDSAALLWGKSCFGGGQVTFGCLTKQLPSFFLQKREEEFRVTTADL
jgi:hypothetical protein